MNEIDCGNGIVLKPSTKKDFKWINKHLRFYDRREVEAFGYDEEPMDLYSKVWTIWYDKDICLGMIGFIAPLDRDNEALVCGLTTENVWKHKKLFVRMSPIVLNAVIDQMPPEIHWIYAMPTLEYVGAIKWLMKVLGFKKDRVYTNVCGVKHQLLYVLRDC